MRTRRAAVAACALLSLSMLAACGEEEAPDPDSVGSPSSSPGDATSPTPEVTPSAEPSPTDATADRSVLTTKGLGQGPPPAVDLLAAADPAQPAGTWSLVRPSGEELGLDVSSPLGFATMGNGL